MLNDLNKQKRRRLRRGNKISWKRPETTDELSMQIGVSQAGNRIIRNLPKQLNESPKMNFLTIKTFFFEK